MSAQMLVRAMETRNLTPSERLVLFCLADCADREGRNAFKSERSIAEHMQLSLRTVKRGLQSLKLKGHIAIQELPTTRRSTTYQLFPNEVATGDMVSPSDQTPRGDNLSPNRGDKLSLKRGATLSPLGVTSGVTFTTVRGDKSANPPTPPYKEDPVFDPVDPSAVSLLSKFASESLDHHPHVPDEWHLDDIRRAAQARRLPHDDRTVRAALDLALSRRGAVQVSA